MQNSRLIPKKCIVLLNHKLKRILHFHAEVATPAQIKCLLVHGVEKRAGNIGSLIKIIDIPVFRIV